MKAEKHTLTNALGGSLTLNLHPSKIRRTGDFKVEWTLTKAMGPGHKSIQPIPQLALVHNLSGGGNVQMPPQGR